MSGTGAAIGGGTVRVGIEDRGLVLKKLSRVQSAELVLGPISVNALVGTAGCWDSRIKSSTRALALSVEEVAGMVKTVGRN